MFRRGAGFGGTKVAGAGREGRSRVGKKKKIQEEILIFNDDFKKIR